MSYFPLTPDNKPNQGPNKPLVGGAVALLLILSAILLKNIGNDIKQLSSPNYSSSNFADGIGVDTNNLPEPAKFDDTQDYSLIIADSIRKNFPSSEIIVYRTISIEGDVSPYIVEPVGIDQTSMPYYADLNNPAYYQDSQPLQQDLMNGNLHILTSSDLPSSGINYRNAFDEATTKGGETIIASESGNPIRVVYQDKYIEIRDNTSKSPAMFWARIDDEGALKLGLFSKSAEDEPYHEDFRVREFLNAVWDVWGYRITEFKPSWSRSSMNYSKYFENLSSGMSSNQAALNTKTGELMATFGFFPHEILPHENPDTGVIEYIEGSFRPNLP